MSTILVIEDDENLQSTITETLRYAGYEVRSASDASAGLTLAQTERPDLVLCDIGLPDHDGFEVFASLRADQRTAQIPVVFLTARAGDEAIREGMELGADDYLCKPVERRNLLRSIQARLRRSNQIEQRIQEQIEKAKFQMASRIPHEMKTPLCGILGWAEVLELGSFERGTGPQTKEIGKVIRACGERLLGLTERFLLFIQIHYLLPHSSDKTSLCDGPPLYVRPMAEEALRALALSSQRSDDLSLSIAEGCVRMESIYFKQLLTDLVDNAMKFSQPGQPLTVTSSLEHARYHLIVTDCGRGMSPQQVRSVGSFVQFDREHWEQQGSGLGLAIVKQLCQLHGGQLRIESQLGVGTRVIASIPGSRCETCSGSLPHWCCPRPRLRINAVEDPKPGDDEDTGVSG